MQFRDDDLPTALERSAVWLRAAQGWLGEPLDVIAVHLDYDDRDGSPYYEVKLLCNEEDLAGAPLAVRRAGQPTRRTIGLTSARDEEPTVTHPRVERAFPAVAIQCPAGVAAARSPRRSETGRLLCQPVFPTWPMRPDLSTRPCAAGPQLPAGGGVRPCGCPKL